MIKRFNSPFFLELPYAFGDDSEAIQLFYHILFHYIATEFGA